MITSDHTLYGIIGKPLKHSLSPVMHNAAFKALDVNAEYRLFPLEEEELDAFFKELKDEACPIFGLNVTVPYKEKVLEYMDSLSPIVQEIGALNTVVITEKRKLVGYNTDAPGFMAHLVELGVETADKKIAILGAGGSARAILGTLCMLPERPKWIKIYNRTTSRAEYLISDLKERMNLDIVESAMSVDDLNIQEADILINTTSVGLKKEDDFLVSEDLLHSDLFVYDLIYNPKETLLLKMAKEAGAKTANGLGMLFFQGALSLQHWADMEIDESVKMEMRQALEEASQ
jgi:shikimate dehydrogenase